MIPSSDPIPALLKTIRAWVTDLTPEHGIGPNELPSFIPYPLRAVYELAGNYPIPFTEQCRAPNWKAGLIGTQDHLLPPDILEVEGDRFRFIQENQGVWSCETVIDEHDPPVYSDSRAYEFGDTKMREACSSLSHFLTTLCLQELVFGAHHLFCVDSEVSDPHDLVLRKLEPVWVKAVYVYNEPTHSFYSCDDGLFVMECGGMFWLAYNEESFGQLVNTNHDIRRIH